MNVFLQTLMNAWMFLTTTVISLWRTVLTTREATAADVGEAMLVMLMAFVKVCVDRRPKHINLFFLESSSQLSWGPIFFYKVFWSSSIMNKKNGILPTKI
jgi:hypothetical protein